MSDRSRFDKWKLKICIGSFVRNVVAQDRTLEGWCHRKVGVGREMLRVRVCDAGDDHDDERSTLVRHVRQH